MVLFVSFIPVKAQSMGETHHPIGKIYRRGRIGVRSRGATFTRSRSSAGWSLRQSRWWISQADSALDGMTTLIASMNPNRELWEKGDFTRIAATMRESGEAL